MRAVQPERYDAATKQSGSLPAACCSVNMALWQRAVCARAWQSRTLQLPDCQCQLGARQDAIARPARSGMQAFPPKPFPKLPTPLFRDMRPRGGLFHIAATCMRQQEARGLKKLDFASPANRKLVSPRCFRCRSEQIDHARAASSRSCIATSGSMPATRDAGSAG